MHAWGMKFKDRLVFPRLSFSAVPIWQSLCSAEEREWDAAFADNCAWMRNLSLTLKEKAKRERVRQRAANRHRDAPAASRGRRERVGAADGDAAADVRRARHRGVRPQDRRQG